MIKCPDCGHEIEEPAAKVNKTAEMVKGCGKIIWIIAAFCTLILLVTDFMASAHAYDSTGTFTAGLVSVVLTAIGGFIAGTIVTGFGELIGILSDMRDTVKRK